MTDMSMPTNSHEEHEPDAEPCTPYFSNKNPANQGACEKKSQTRNTSARPYRPRARQSGSGKRAASRCASAKTVDEKTVDEMVAAMNAANKRMGVELQGALPALRRSRQQNRGRQP